MNQGKIDPDLWKEHFPTVLPSRVPECTDCLDKKNNLCEGGKNPVDCFLSIQREKEEAESGSGDSGKKKQKKQNTWSRKEQEQKNPAGTQHFFDQSRI